MRAVNTLFLPQFATIEFEGVKFSLQHLTPRAVEVLYPEFSDFESFAITRNPYEKCLSSYFWLRKNRDGARMLRFSERAFRRWCVTEAARMDWDHTLPQHHWVKGTDHTFNMSQYDEVTRIFEARMPRTSNAELHVKRNRFNTRRIVERLSTQSLDLIYNLYEEDFDLLKYPRSYK